MPYFLALDAGGTKTHCWLADENTVLAHCRCGSVKIMRVGEVEASDRLRALLTEAATVSGVSLREIGRTCIGLAGISLPVVRSWAERALRDLLAGELILLGDDEIALEAAFRGGAGILVIAGTGSNIVGRDPSGSIGRAGGWGPAVGDEGSGHWIAVEAIRTGLHALDRGSAPPVLDALREHWKLPSIADLVARASERPSPDFSSLVPVVAHCAELGDPVATEVLSRAGTELARQITVVARKLHFAPDDAIPIAYTGSVLTHVSSVRTAMLAGLAAHLPQAVVQADPVEPLEGALWRARRGV